MSNLREAAQQALETMESLHRTGDTQVFDMYGREATEALRAALAESKEKPWRCACGANLYIDENGAPRSKA